MFISFHVRILYMYHILSYLKYFHITYLILSYTFIYILILFIYGTFVCFHLILFMYYTFICLLLVLVFFIFQFYVLFHIVATRPCCTFHSSFSYLYYHILSYYMLLSCTFHMLSSCTIHILYIHLYVLILSYTLCFRILSVLFLYWFKTNTFISYLYFSYYVNFYLIFPVSRRSIRLILLLSYHILSYVFIYVFMCFHILYFLLKIKPTSPHACACFSPYLAFLFFSFFNFPELMQCTVIIIIDLESF